MKKQSKMAKLARSIQIGLSKHSPEILVGIGIAGMVTSTVLAVKATPKAVRLLEEEKRLQETEELKPLDVIKTTWKCYIPAAVTCGTSVACLIGGTKVNLRRNAALATAYKLSETALSEYRDKVTEMVGEKKERVIREEVGKERIAKNPVSKSGNEIIMTSKGNTLCFDPLSGRYFKSDIEQIKRVVNELNKQMIHDIFGYVSLNDLYDELGLEHTTIGDDLGWSLDNGEGLIDLDFSSHIAANGEPAVVLDFLIPPKYGYSYQ